MTCLKKSEFFPEYVRNKNYKRIGVGITYARGHAISREKYFYMEIINPCYILVDRLLGVIPM